MQITWSVNQGWYDSTHKRLPTNVSMPFLSLQGPACFPHCCCRWTFIWLSVPISRPQCLAGFGSPQELGVPPSHICARLKGLGFNSLAHPIREMDSGSCCSFLNSCKTWWGVSPLGLRAAHPFTHVSCWGGEFWMSLLFLGLCLRLGVALPFTPPPIALKRWILAVAALTWSDVFTLAGIFLTCSRVASPLTCPFHWWVFFPPSSLSSSKYIS